MPPWRSRLRTRFAHWGFLFLRPMTLGVRGVVIDETGRVLLVKHGYVPGWHFPGGGVEVGETCAQSLARELEEEARVVIDAPPVLHGLFLNAKSSRRDHIAVYVVRGFSIRGARAPDWEIKEARFFAPADLPDGTTAGTRARLAEIFDSAPIPGYW